MLLAFNTSLRRIKIMWNLKVGLQTLIAEPTSKRQTHPGRRQGDLTFSFIFHPGSCCDLSSLTPQGPTGEGTDELVSDVRLISRLDCYLTHPYTLHREQVTDEISFCRAYWSTWALLRFIIFDWSLFQYSVLGMFFFSASQYND